MTFTLAGGFVYAEHPNYGKGVKVNLAIQVGDTYAIPLTNGRYGICRVVNTSASRSIKFQGYLGFNAPLVVATHYTFEKQPTINEIFPERNIYIDNLNRHMESSDPKEHLIKFYVHTSPPGEFIYLGNIKPTSIESELPAMNIGDWHNLKNQW